jgi:hypothetical protein
VSATIIVGIAEQWKGYLPSSFFADLVNSAIPFLPSSPSNQSLANISATFDNFFNNATSYGPRYVTCLAQVQQCVVAAIRSSGTIDAVCAGPQAGCSLTRRRRMKRAMEGSDGSTSSRGVYARGSVELQRLHKMAGARRTTGWRSYQGRR